MNQNSFGRYVTRIAPDGSVYPEWEGIGVNRQDERITNSVAYFFKSVRNATEGKKGGGSGLVVSKLADDESGFHHYLVTAWHVTKGGAGSCVVKINHPDGHSPAIIRDLRGTKWYRSSEADDLAVCPIHITEFHPHSIPEDVLVSRELLRAYNIGPGDEVVMSGRFTDYSGVERNRVILRFGRIAEPPFCRDVGKWA
jgi:hypothetical protein